MEQLLVAVQSYVISVAWRSYSVINMWIQLGFVLQSLQCVTNSTLFISIHWHLTTKTCCITSRGWNTGKHEYCWTVLPELPAYFLRETFSQWAVCLLNKIIMTKKCLAVTLKTCNECFTALSQLFCNIMDRTARQVTLNLQGRT